MAHLTKPVKYDIKDSNIALLGSDLEKRVREHAGYCEAAWQHAGSEPGLQVWRIEKFKVVAWDRLGSFYDGDSYIVLNTYKKTDSDALSYDLHFWLGEFTSQDEAGTAAYKTVELDDHLHGTPVQYREVQQHESARFLSYFPHFICLRGGISTGFHHISTPPPPDTHKLYRITVSRKAESHHVNLIVREVTAEASSLVEGDVFVLDKGDRIWQFNTKTSVGQGKFKAAEFVQGLVGSRQNQCDITVYDEGEPGAGIFLSEFGQDTLPRPQHTQVPSDTPPMLFRVSDPHSDAFFEGDDLPRYTSLSSSYAYLLDHTSDSEHPTIYLWIGKKACLNERRLAVHYAQQYVHRRRADGIRVDAAVSIVTMKEGNESTAFLEATKAYRDTEAYL